MNARLKHILDLRPPNTTPTADEYAEVIQAVRDYHPKKWGARLRRWEILARVRIHGMPTDEDIRDALAPR